MAKKNNDTLNAIKEQKPETLEDHAFYGLRLDENQRDFRDAIWSPNLLAVFCNSKAGSGKTTVALATANLLVQYGFYDDIIYVVTPYAEYRQGYLPGSISEKSMYYFQPVYQAAAKLNINPMTAFCNDNMLAQKNGTGYITCSTDTYIRGSTLSRSVIILDEAQNLSHDQIKTLITRISDDSKLICIGHVAQCDLKDKSTSGFARCIEHFKEKEWAKICTLTKNFRGILSAWADEM